MKQVFFVRTGTHTILTNYTNLFSEYDSGAGWVFTEASMRAPWPCAGVLRNLGIWRDPAPGTGESVTITLRVNGAATALVCVLSGTNQSAVTTGTDISVVLGDLITVSYVTSASPAALNHPEIISIEFEGSVARESGYAIATTGAITGTKYDGVFRGPSNWSNSDGLNHRDVVAVPGALTGFWADFETAPGSGKSITFTIRKNGVDQDGSGGTPDTRLTISDSATTGSATFALTLAVGDEVNVKAVATNSPASNAIGIGVSFVADTDGYSQYCGHANDSPDSGVPTYAPPCTPDQAGTAWDTTEADVEWFHCGATGFQLIGLVVKLGTAPGSGGDAYTFDGRVNGATPTGAPSVTITDAADEGADAVGAMAVAPGDTLALQASPSVTPAATNANWAWGQFISTLNAVRVTQLVALLVQDRPPDPAIVSPPTGGGTVGAGTNPAAGLDLCGVDTPVVFMDLTPPGGTLKRYTSVPINVTVPDEPSVKSFGSIVRALTSRSGGDLRGSQVTIELFDTDRLLRDLEGNGDGLTDALVEIYISTETAIKAGSTPRRVFSGNVTDSEPLGGLEFRLTASDWLQRILDLDPEPRYPSRLFTLTDFPNMGNDPADPVNPGNPTMIGKPVPVGYGLLSDEAKGLSAVGVVPGIFTGTRYIPYFAMDWDEYVLFGHAPAGDPLALFVPISPFGPSLAVARLKETLATLPVATDWLFPGQADWTSAFGSAVPYRDFNGRRYCVIYGRGPRSILARTGQVPVVVNLGGVEDVGDGSGNLIESLPLQFLDLLHNLILGDYQSGARLAAPTVNGYSRTNQATFAAAKTRSEVRTASGWLGAFLLGWDGEGVSLRELARMAYEHGLYLGQNKDGQIIGSVIDPAAAAARTISDITDTLAQSFRARRQRTEIRNYVLYRYGRLYTPPLPEPTPAVGDALPASLRQPQREWDVDDQVQTDSASDTKYGTRKMGADGGLSLELTRDSATAEDIVAQHLEVLAPGPVVAAVKDSLCGTNVELGQNLDLDHFEGLDAAGWDDRLLRCERHTLILGGLEKFAVEFESLDLENLPVPT